LLGPEISVIKAPDVNPPITDTAIDVFVARQPIFQRDLKVYGYELLYRAGKENVFDGTPADVATARVIANFVLTIGAEQLLNGKPAFLNFDATLVTLEYAALLPADSAVVEILESTPPTPDILASCNVLKRRGCHFALDDVTCVEQITPWLGVVDIVKVDFRRTDEATRARILAACKQSNVHTLAEKVETQTEFELAAGRGYDYFQGFFFARPTIIKRSAVSDDKLLLLQLLREVSVEDVNFDAMEKLLQRNAALVYKLLRYVNSPLFGWRAKIKSLSHAIALLGQEELRKWISLLLVAGLGQDAVPELIVKSLVRARFAELLASQMRLSTRPSSAFLLGLLSHLDVLLHCTMEEALAGLRLEDELANALLARSKPRDVLGRLYRLLGAYENGDRVRTYALAHDLRIPLSALSDVYLKATAWADVASAE
jgi:c-di-GMP-related signal transduction protein